MRPFSMLPDARGNFVDHIIIVRHQQYCAGIPLQRNVEGIDGFQVKMICGFIQDQEVGFLKHQTAKDKPGSFPARESISPFKGIITTE